MKKLLKKISQTMVTLASLFLLLLTFVSFVDIAGRFLFNSPLKFSVEVTQLAMGLVTVFGIVATTFNQSHTSVDILARLFPRWLQDGLHRLGALIGTVVFALIAWSIGKKAISSFEDNLYTDILEIPLFPFIGLAALGIAVAAIASLFFVFNEQPETHTETEVG